MQSEAMHPGIGTEHPPHRHTEGRSARAIERYTAQIPSDAFLWVAVASMAGSLALQLSGRREEANFVGQWAPTLLILGLYNKLVKIAGSDWRGEH